MSSTKLRDRELRYDGVSIVKPEDTPKFLMSGLEPADLRVTAIDQDVERFNEQLPFEALQLATEEPLTLRYSWKLPQKYLELDVDTHMFELLNQASTPYPKEQAVARVQLELREFKLRGLVDLLRTIIYVMDVFREKQVVWGVGRGSSCASYVLFLLGLHVVDPILYEVDLEEFMH